MMEIALPFNEWQAVQGKETLKNSMRHRIKRAVFVVLRIYLLVGLVISVMQRKLLYIPSHASRAGEAKELGMEEWVVHGEVIGYQRVALTPKRIWLYLHGNAGQAIDRGHTLNTFDRHDNVYILEYPGYGSRRGAPSRKSFNRAAETAYEYLRNTFPEMEVNVFSESIGSGPGCHLATLPLPPNRLVLVVPFDRLVDVVAEKLPFFPISIMLRDQWDNMESLSHFSGAVDIYGATQDTVIPMHHAQKLADSVPGSRFHPIIGGHNDWADRNNIDLRMPNDI